MFVLDSGRFAQDPQGTEDTVKDYLAKCNAELVASAPWQEGKLAYEMDGHRKGLHYLTYFRMEGSEVDHLNRLCKLSDVVVRHLILEHEPKLFELMIQQLTEGGAHGESETEEATSAASE